MKDEASAALDKAVSLGDKSKDMYTVLFRLRVDRKDWRGADGNPKGRTRTSPTS